MHPIIKEYLNSNTPVTEIAENFYDKNQEFDVIFLEVTKAAAYKIEIESSIFSRIDHAVKIGHSDQNFYFLFLLIAISFSASENQFEKANTLHSIAVSLTPENFPPIMQAFYMQATTRTNAIRNNTNEIRKLMKKAVVVADRHHPRYRGLLTNYAAMLASEGKLYDLDENESSIFNMPAPPFKAQITAEAKLINSVNIGDYQNGFNLINEVKSIFPESRKFIIHDSFNILKIISGDFDESHYEDESFKLLIQIFQSLLEGRLEDAMKLRKEYVSNSNLKAKYASISDYIILNYELLKGNSEAARITLENKKEMGNFHYLDDLFFARVQLLENNFEEARQSFAKLIKSVEYYGALNRALFELQFAKEIKPTDFFLLMNNWKNVKISIAPKIKNNIPMAIVLKGVKLLIGNSHDINQVKTLVKKFAPLKEIVLITGETGTGKELIAKALHEEGFFSKEPFLAINCGALTDTLLESELFGYEAGSFTGALKQKKGIFEAAGKGTVFLDEFGDISTKLQVSLLRVLESNEIRMIGGINNRKIECRIVVATNIELKRAVEEKKFREDLYFRLTRLEINLPPLRARKNDVPELVDYFLQAGGITNKKILVSKDFLKAFENYQWPGNIRELKNCIERLKILNPEKNMFTVEDLSFMQFQGAVSLPQNTIEPQSIDVVNEEKIDSDLHDDPILNLIHQSGLKPEQRILYLKELFQKYKILTRSQIMKITNVNPIAATKELQQLCDEGFIIRRAPSKSPRSVYFELK